MSLIRRRSKPAVPGSVPGAADGASPRRGRPGDFGAVPVLAGVRADGQRLYGEPDDLIPDQVPMEWTLTYGMSARIEVRKARRRRWGRRRQGGSPV